jgi:ATPase involved in DNA repair
MLTLLRIKNIALIEDISISLGAGLNILSGETGAGKSIIIDSLNFVLGERADKTLIRYGAESASVDATFEGYLTPAVAEYMQGIGVDAEEVLLLRRVMSTSGKNECRINGQPVTLGMLKGLTELIADIHGQHEHQSLLKTSTHINILDAFGGQEIATAANAVKKAYSDYKALLAEYARFGNSEERARRIDVLTYQVEELERAALVPGEEDTLLAERKKV